MTNATYNLLAACLGILAMAIAFDAIIDATGIIHPVILIAGTVVFTTAVRNTIGGK